MMGAQAPMMPKLTSSLRVKSVGGPNGEGLGDLHSCQSVPYAHPRHVVRENLPTVCSPNDANRASDNAKTHEQVERDFRT